MPVIAVDGPVASGKGSLARRLAAHYDFHHLDTGLLYRAVAYAMLKAGGDPHNAEQAAYMARALGGDVIDEPALRTARIGALASVIAVHQPVRCALLDAQRVFARRRPGAVLDGRDIGTRVCPDADVKIYVDASPEIRAWRRWRELAERGDPLSFEEMLRQIHERDARDKTRELAPLHRAEEACLLDTTELGIEETFKRACHLVDKVLERQ